MKASLTNQEQEKIINAVVAANKNYCSEEAIKNKIKYINDNNPSIKWQTDFVHSYQLREINKRIKDTGICYSMSPVNGGIDVDFFKYKL